MKAASFFFIALFFAQCGVNGKMKGIKVINNWPIVYNDGSVYNARDSFEYYKNGDICVYKIPVLHTSTLVQKGIEYPLPDHVRFEYLFFRKKSDRGVLFFNDTVKAENLSVDSFLILRGIRTNPEIFFVANDSLLVINEIERGNRFCAIYLPRIKYDRSYNDTSFFYFTLHPFNQEYTLNRKLDSLYNARVEKIRLFYNPYHDSTINRQVGSREILYEMRNCTLDNRLEFNRIKDLFLSKKHQ
jgi:hypothetical protein